MSSRPGRRFWTASCGHQHQSPEQARNCAVNQLRAHPRLDRVEVQRVNRRQLDAENPRFALEEIITRAQVHTPSTEETNEA
jgi:hypothetical protein